ncbi:MULTISPECIES: sensor histidine kinase [Mesonia]|uniref:Sensor protein ZraS n=1 Tax=Mesonia oceanica TaxID=2687242 RepID=A0AC61Y5F0_9FLAO|nr:MULTISPECIES: HAMP domain-containing sensor histidine kinase [Mesonia]MAN28704.1 two-component sensor histidine kinase [Mesonia sp.]MAQ41949.1 two-component sensor histidine kinase [Mesonia sp.]MBJ99371.1 two-component sensor histidine kinase [Flavobacteriaceae bacterium]VVU99627.1 Sensor protein ZraS [Mesonia oceanica]|tara:strand:- start:6312 stop:7463 length:1152 start_codon:yes stop_codon:yes gene_type:complete
MTFNDENRFIRWFILVSSVAIVGIFLWNVSIFFNRLKKEERDKMEIWVNAYSEILNSDLNEDIPVELMVLSKNTSTPMIIYNQKDDLYDSRNIPRKQAGNKEQIEELVTEFSSEYKPIEIAVKGEKFGTLYYGNSSLLNKLKYFPIGILMIVILYLAMLYYFYSTTKSHDQSKLWAGMAKETAHQIGTPLSSLVGWTEILKQENVDPSYVEEMEKDIYRLQTITDRFSKIGSLPVLAPTDIVEETVSSYEYLKARSSKLINFSLKVPKEKILVNLNPQLFSWTVENLVKNAIDALKGKGDIDVEIIDEPKRVNILITDTGKGIAKSKYKKIFKPGFTTKKRGWGLGLSLAKRIIEEYHNGKIKVLKSEVGKGTTFEIKLKKID